MPNTAKPTNPDPPTPTPTRRAQPRRVALVAAIVIEATLAVLMVAVLAWVATILLTRGHHRANPHTIAHPSFTAAAAVHTQPVTEQVRLAALTTPTAPSTAAVPGAAIVTRRGPGVATGHAIVAGRSRGCAAQSPRGNYWDDTSEEDTSEGTDDSGAESLPGIAVSLGNIGVALDAGSAWARIMGVRGPRPRTTHTPRAADAQACRAAPDG